jgi:hypothetical protein
MLEFSSQQISAIGESRFQERLLEFLLKNQPDTQGVLDTTEGKKTLAEQCSKARHYGLSTELALANYVITAWLLGADFDTRFPAMNEILSDPTTDGTQKSELIAQIASLVLGKLEAGAP